MKKHVIFLPLLASLCFLWTSAHAKESSTGIVNFITCITDSQYGKQEQEAFEDFQNKQGALIKDIEEKLQEIATKFQDPEFIDSLSPEAEQELNARKQMLEEEYFQRRQQAQGAQQQANAKLVQLMSYHVSQASEIIAKKQKLSAIIHKDACFYYEPKQDVTASVIAEMDKSFEKEAKAEKINAPSDPSSKQALD